jgi:hypothetical protein
VCLCEHVSLLGVLLIYEFLLQKIFDRPKNIFKTMSDRGLQVSTIFLLYPMLSAAAVLCVQGNHCTRIHRAIFAGGWAVIARNQFLFFQITASVHFCVTLAK